MRRYLVSLAPTAAMLAVVVGACGSGGTSLSDQTPLATIKPDTNLWNTIATVPTTLSPAVDAGGGGGITSETGIPPYEIQSGDYWFKLQNDFGCKWELIAGFNDLPVEPDQFPMPGSVLNIPPECVPDPAAQAAATDVTEASAAATPATTSADGTFPYEIQPNDAMYSIAKNFNVTMDALMAANGWTGDPAAVKLFVGKTIKIPGG